MLVVQVDALGRVDVLDGLDEGVHRGLDVRQAAELAEVDEAVGDLLAGAHLHAVLDARHETGGGGDAPLLEDAGVVVEVAQLDAVLGLLGRDAQAAGVRRQVGLAAQDLLVDVADDVEHAGNRREALRDVVSARDAAGVNGTHRELGARLADGLGGDDTDRGADVDGATGGEVPAVALLADAVLGLAGEQGAQLDLAQAGVPHALQVVHGLDMLAAGHDDLAGLGVDDVVEGAAADQVGVERGLARLHQVVGDALVGTAVLLAHDHVLGDVDQTTGQVTGVGRVRGRVDQALTGAVGRDEVLERHEALAEVGLDGQVDGLAGHIGHQAAHTRELAQLGLGATGAGIGHHVDGVVIREAFEHLGAQKVGAGGPGVDDLVVTLRLGQEAVLVALVDLVDLVLSLVQHVLLVARDDGVPHGDRQARDRGVVEARGLDGIQDRLDLSEAVAVATVVDQLGDIALDHLIVHVGIVGRQALAIEDDAASGRHEASGVDADVVVLGLAAAHIGAENLRVAVLDIGVGSVDAHDNALLQVHVGIAVVGGQHVLEIGIDGQLLDGQVVGLLGGQVVDTEDHVLRRHGEHLARRGRAQVVGRQHQHAGLGLGLGGQGDMDRHLVAVEVRVEGSADQRVQVDGLALDQHGLEGLNGQAVQRGGAVQKDQAVLDDLVEHVPDDRGGAVDGALGALDVLDLAQLDQATHDEGLEELECHGRG